MATLSSPPGFTKLPFELRHMVLSSTPDLPTLHSLILSSPAYHATFAASRDVILAQVLTRELAGSKVIVEALAVTIAAAVSESKPETVDSGLDFCVFESEMKVCFPGARWSVPVGFARRMSGYQRTVRELTERFFEEKGRDRALGEMTPSSAERLRVQGAFYRLWLFGSLLDRSPSSIEAIELLISKLNPAYGKWKLQEAVVVLDYLRDRLRSVLLSSPESEHDVSPRAIASSGKLMDMALTRLLSSGLSTTHSILHLNASPSSLLASITSASSIKRQNTVYELLSQMTWLSDFHYDYEARRICSDYVQWESQWIYNERVQRNACIWDDERLRAWGYQLPDQTPRPCHWFFSLGR